MTPATDIQPQFNTQVEVEQLVFNLSLNAAVVQRTLDDHKNVLTLPEYEMMGNLYHALLNNVRHLVEYKDIESLPYDPQRRVDQVELLIKRVREAKIGVIGLKIAELT